MEDIQGKLDCYELLALGTRIKHNEGTASEISKMIDDFNRCLPQSNGSSLFFYPKNYKSSEDDISSYNPTVEKWLRDV